MNLTLSEIKNLAEFAGMTVSTDGMGDEMDSEITVSQCPEEGLGSMDDDGIKRYSGHYAYFSDYSDEGLYPLGEEITD